LDELKITIPLNPVTKKNSQQIKYRWAKKGRRVPYIAPSEAFMNYQALCMEYLNKYRRMDINEPVNCKYIYYMDKDYSKLKIKIDQANLINGTDDILVHYGVLHDDDSKIVKGHDGSRVRYDKVNPRVEITITVVPEGW
jgi:Holliday junction resolvase RusA-like endonuclease